MQQTMKRPFVRILSMVLVAVMLISVPLQATAAVDEPLTGSTGSGWDDVGGVTISDYDSPDDDGSNSGSGNYDEDWNDTGGSDDDDDWDSGSGSNTGGGSSSNEDDDDDDWYSEGGYDGDDDDRYDADDLEAVDDSDPDAEVVEEEVTEDTQISLGASGDWIQDYISVAEQWAMKDLLDWGEDVSGVPDTVMSSWTGSDITFANGGRTGTTIPIITFNGTTAFCYEWNGVYPGGFYTYDYNGTDTVIKQYIANYDALKTSDSKAYIAMQTLVWARLMNTTVSSWGDSGAASYASQIQSGNADYSNVQYSVYGGDYADQSIFIYTNEPGDPSDKTIRIMKASTSGKLLPDAVFSITGPNGFSKNNLTTNSQGYIDVEIEDYGTYTVTEETPPAGYLPAGGPQTVEYTATSSNPLTVMFVNEPDTPEEGSGLRIEVEAMTETTVNTYQSTTFDYSDAIGQVTIIKQDQDGNPLAGALFNILVEFTNGESILVENWEVTNGSRLFTWTHPDNNHDPATVTIWEVQAPRYYEIVDPTPKVVEVRPTYTRVTIVTNWQESVWTYFYRWTVWEIGADGEEVILETWDQDYDTDYKVTYEIIQEHADFIEGDRETTVTFRNQRTTGDIIVEKRDANTGELLAGAEITVTGTDLGEAGEYREVKITDSDGKAYFTDLFPGTYTVQETQPPYGYNGNDEIQTVTVQSGETKTVVVRNYKKDGLFIKKVDEYGQPLAGATFELRRGSGEVLLREVTDENGLIYRGYLTDDTYVIEEIAAPKGYLLDENPIQSIRIYESDDNKEYTVTFVNMKKPAIEIEKVDGKNPTLKLEGAVFKITNSQTGQYDYVQTGSDGKALLEELEIGTTYIVEEYTAPAGYQSSGFRQEIVLSEARVHTIIVENYTLPELRIVKKDGYTGELLGGATFTIALDGSNKTQSVTTDSSGIGIITGLTPGTYTIIETKAPTGYILDDTPHTVIVTEGEDTVIELYNFKNPSLTILKKDKATGEVLGGASFRVTWNNGADFRDVTTKEDGTAVITDLNSGWYTIVETRAPDGYLLDETPHQVYLEPGQDAVIEIFDEAKPSLEILKVDSVTKTPLQYARFRIELKTETGTTLIGEYTSDENGLIYLENIVPGRYLVTEIEAPDGYNIDTESYEVTIEYGQTYQLTFTNTPKGPIYIAKVDEQGNPLAGAKFKVTTMNGALVGEVTTGRTGYAIIPYVEPGWYVVEEITAPDGYILSSTPVNIEVKSGQPATVEFVNYKKPTLQIEKRDADTLAPLGGAYFKITTANGTYVDEVYTDINGIAVIENLEPGSYIVAETRAPDGYILDITPQTVTLEAGKTASLTFYDVGKPGLQLLKLDKVTGLPVGGARFQVHEISGGYMKDLGYYTTSDSGTFYISDLSEGYYQITEVQAADGYFLDNTPQTIYVEGGKLNVVTFYNVPYSDLQLLKVDSETLEPLPGAVFKLYDASAPYFKGKSLSVLKRTRLV